MGGGVLCCFMFILMYVILHSRFPYRPIWNDHSRTDKIHTYLVSLGTNLILKRNTRCDNMAMAVAFAVIELEERSAYGGNRYNNMYVDTDTGAKHFFGSRINCSCLKDIQFQPTANGSVEEQPSQRAGQRGTLHVTEDEIVRQMATHYIVNGNKERFGTSCNHGAAEKKMIMNSLETVSPGEASNVYDKFMPAFENTMNHVLSTIDDLPHEKKQSMDNPVKMNALVVKILLRDHSGVLPNHGKEDVRKIVCSCLVALGTDYLLQAKKHHAERFTKMASVVRCHTVFWEKKGDHEKDLRDNDVYKITQFFDERNGCDCLKGKQSNVDDDDDDGGTKGSSAETKSGVCGSCQQFKEKVMKCKGCKGIRYCSKTCQRADWPRHKAVCKQQQKNSKK